MVNRINVLESQPRNPSNEIGLSTNDARLLCSEMMDVQAKVQDLTNSGKPKSIIMVGSHFESLRDVVAWSKTHLADDDIGLIVYSHTVLEHVLSAVDGEDFMESFLKCYKLKIETITQGIAMITFERPIPKLFSTNATKVVRDDSSYLDKIATWDDWNYP